MNINGGHHKKLHKAHKSPLISALSLVRFVDGSTFLRSRDTKEKKSIKSNLPKTVKIEWSLEGKFFEEKKRPEAILIQLSDEEGKKEMTDTDCVIIIYE